VSVTALLDVVSGRRAAAAPPAFARPKQPQLVAKVDDEARQGKRNATLASVSAQYSLHAAQADAVALSQSPLGRSRVAVVEHLLDDLLAEAVDESPPLALWRKRWTLLLVLFKRDPVR
jgi:hypothetical protein